MRLVTLCFALGHVQYVKQDACVCKAASPFLYGQHVEQPAWCFAAGQDKKFAGSSQGRHTVPTRSACSASLMQPAFQAAVFDVVVSCLGQRGPDPLPGGHMCALS